MDQERMQMLCVCPNTQTVSAISAAILTDYFNYVIKHLVLHLAEAACLEQLLS